MDDPRPRLEKALEGQYIFERELGGGGMSRTYLVRERALDRRVVAKVLAPELQPKVREVQDELKQLRALKG